MKELKISDCQSNQPTRLGKLNFDDENHLRKIVPKTKFSPIANLIWKVFNQNAGQSFPRMILSNANRSLCVVSEFSFFSNMREFWFSFGFVSKVAECLVVDFPWTKTTPTSAFWLFLPYLRLEMNLKLFHSDDGWTQVCSTNSKCDCCR